MHGYPVPMPQGTELFERLELFEGGLRQGWKGLEEAYAVAVNAYMPQWFGQC